MTINEKEWDFMFRNNGGHMSLLLCGFTTLQSQF